jgi:large subunit ribosomal protein L22
MTGPKLNEKNLVPGTRSGTKASALYIRGSASKARLVLDIIRDLPVREADAVLQFTDKGVAVTIRKVLASAVANAQHNDLQDPEELYVKACFADDGPTLRRFAARARGRGTRINKRTCHITIILDRLDEERLAVLQAKESSRTAGGRRRGVTSSAAARRERVARSRQRAEALKAEAAGEETPSHMTEAQVADAAPQWEGSALPNEDGSAPEGFEIKGNANSMKYHEPGTRYYEQTAAEVYFDSVESAEAAGFSPTAEEAAAHEEEAGGEGSASDESSEDLKSGGEGSASDEPQSSETKAKRTSSETTGSSETKAKRTSGETTGSGSASDKPQSDEDTNDESGQSATGAEGSASEEAQSDEAESEADGEEDKK